MLIDGYDYGKDWLNDEVLFAVCKKLKKDQVFFFGFKEKYFQSEFIKKLVDDGIVVPIKESLITILEEAQSKGLIESSVGDLNSDDLVISVAGKRRIFPRKKLRNITRTCKVLDDFQFEFEVYPKRKKRIYLEIFI